MFPKSNDIILIVIAICEGHDDDSSRIKCQIIIIQTNDVSRRLSACNIYVIWRHRTLDDITITAFGGKGRGFVADLHTFFFFYRKHSSNV